jgi:periplasmic divalent cation tolerance protein
MTGYIQVFTTVDSEELAQRIARALVERRLAACAQVIGPIQSTYWWEGALETAEEWLCLLKSREDRYQQLSTAIHELHPYDVPEILAVPVSGGSADYLAWLNAALTAPD